MPSIFHANGASEAVSAPQKGSCGQWAASLTPGHEGSLTIKADGIVIAPSAKIPDAQVYEVVSWIEEVEETNEDVQLAFNFEQNV